MKRSLILLVATMVTLVSLLGTIRVISTGGYGVAEAQEIAPLKIQDAGTEQAAAVPSINVWYGSNQTFGQIGNPQQWVNILGSTTNAVSLTYRLNGGPENVLSLGPDGGRLEHDGDFNIELDHAALLDGDNTVEIVAVDASNNSTSEFITVNYASGNSWPMPYSTDWGSATPIDDQSWIVDGQWVKEGSSVRTQESGYDRLVAIGDEQSWTNFEVTVPITIHNIETPNADGVGIIMRWQGHSQVADEQPRIGWEDLGAYGYYRFRTTGNHLALRLGSAEPMENHNVELSFGQRYIYKLRAQTVTPTGDGLYKIKVWEDGQPEPINWDLSAVDTLPDDLDAGSLLLSAHRVDASFGDVTITPLSEISTDLLVNVDGRGSVTIDPPGPYTEGQNVTLTAIPDPGWVFTGWSGDLSGTTNPETVNVSGIVSVVANFSLPTGTIITSDDFNACGLNTALWTWVDPLGDSTLTMTGAGTSDAWLNIEVPEGVRHTLSETNLDAPRIMQAADNTDFEIEAKFESPMDSEFQIQGIIIEEVPNERFLRFDFHSDGLNTLLYAGSFTTPTLDTRTLATIAVSNTAPLYMRITRSGDAWTQSYSFNGTDWTSRPSFFDSINVTAVGFFVGNSGSNPPGHIGSIDYFFNTDSPVIPEDGAAIPHLDVSVVGRGSVAQDPEGPYSCGDTVTLTATPDPDWGFVGWSGDIAATSNPLLVTMNDNISLVATFSQDPQTLEVDIVGSGTVDVNPPGPYDFGDIVTLTAQPAPGWLFHRWSGDLIGSANPAQLTMNGNKFVTARFVQGATFLPVITKN